jgi:hypothetical protein
VTDGQSPKEGINVIVLVTLNAKFIHASLGLRYLYANMGELKTQTLLREFTIARPAQEIVDELLATFSGSHAKQGHAQQGDGQQGDEDDGPPIVGFGVYIWNVTQTAAVIRLLRAARPEVRVVLGGPEVSYELDEQEIVRIADHVITGWGEVSFAKLCSAILAGKRPREKVIVGEQPPLELIAFPYDAYSESDLANRLLYVEASRGCPFKCQFCLSSLDRTAWPFDLDSFLAQMLRLHRRGARNFKFVDRTFNLKIDASIRILEFFIERLGESDDPLFLHFEVVPDHLPERLRQTIARFPAGVLQFEVGVQTFNGAVQHRISRRQDNERTEANLRWLVGQSNAHVHADLVFGLPGETLESFASGFDRLYSLGPNEIQLGLLKRLRGAPIARLSDDYGMVYDCAPPYTVQQSAAVDSATMQRFVRFARYWNLVANSGRFSRTMTLLLEGEGAIKGAPINSPFNSFLAFADWLWLTSGKTSGLSPEALVDALFDYLRCELPATSVEQALLADYLASGARGSPRALRGLLPRRAAPHRHERPLAQRQARHLAARPDAD